MSPPSAAPLRDSRCAICRTRGGATELYAANFTPEALNPETFSARRLPDRVHHRIVRCDACGLLRSDPVADDEVLAALYARSAFSYAREVGHLRRTYGRYLARARRHAARWESVLEVGCGNGFFLEEARRRGLEDAWGVEPSAAAVAAAPAALAGRIVRDVLRPGLFADDRFDVVCMFQVFDHLPDPLAALDECRRVLRPGGVLLALNHNVDALSARLLGRRSPIIDVEHTYLYGLDTMARIFAAAGLDVVERGKVWNDYSLHYLARLVPAPRLLKSPLLALLRLTGAGRLPLRVPLGNLYQIGRKPAAAAAAAA